jgi:enoyl-CoA hydratase/carnithine racemase
MDSVGLRTEDVRGVRWILFDRPEALNALRRADIVEARALVEEASRSLDAVAFRGVGEVSFSAGLHVEEFVDLTPELARRLIGNLEAMLEVVRRVPIPTLCAVNGYCLGGAMELAMVCDVRVASENAVFGMPEIKVGIPSVLDAALLQQHVGLSKAKEMLLTGDLYGTAEMDRHGFLNKVVEPHRLDEEAALMLDRLTRHSGTALAAQKRLFETWQNASLEGAIGASVDEFARAFESEETLTTIAEYATRLREKKSRREEA